MEKKKKIIGFDSWLGGLRSYHILFNELEKESIDFNLVHISSWGNDVDCPLETNINGLNCRDIRFYGNDDFEKILDIEQPDLVVLTSTDTFAHRAMIRYCKKRSIPTLNMYHGIRSVIDAEDFLGSPNIPFLAYLRNIISKIAKLLIHTFPVYIKSLWKTNAGVSDWIRFLTDVLQFAIGRDPAYVKSSQDSSTTKCAVYVDSDIKHAMSCYGFMKEDILVVGNPDFNNFGMNQTYINCWHKPENGNTKSIIYIETGFSSCGFYYSSTQDFINHLLKTSQSLSDQGFSMSLKLKPNQLNEKEILAGLNNSDIKIIDNDSFLENLRSCHGCIAERTSLALLPCLMGVPLFLCKYGSLKNVAYGEVLKSFPKGHELFDIQDLSTSLRSTLLDSNDSNLKEWIDINAGPVPFEEMPKRVVSLMQDMMSEQ